MRISTTEAGTVRQPELVTVELRPVVEPIYLADAPSSSESLSWSECHSLSMSSRASVPR